MWTWAGIAALALGPSACATGLDDVEFETVTSPQPGVVLAFEGIEVPVGLAVAAAVEPLDESGEPLEEEAEVLLYSANPDVLGVEPGDIDDPRVFVFYGSKPGSTSVKVEIDGVVEGEIPATVVPQK